ncbi:MAG: tetratricopeptide repeat protein [Phycisphaerae bacterium]|nr:tetratricopeptide repeat protein [Phycisphaerae bacterium]
MYVWFLLGSLAMGQVPSTQPSENPLSAARQAYQKGEYSLAEQQYRKDIQSSPSPAAVVGLSQTLRMTGRYAQAVDLLRSQAIEGQTTADLHRETAHALRDVGQYADALLQIEQADALQPDHAETILLRGQLLETLGRKDDALAVYTQMERILDTDDYQRDAPTLTALGRIMDRHAILTGRKASDQARNILHNYFQRAYQKVDPTYWQANLAAARFLLEKHNTAQALEEIKLARKSNPNLPTAHAGLGYADLQKYQFQSCLVNVNKALAINPNHPEALCLQAGCYMQWRKFDKAIPPLEKILAVNPNHIEALSLLAAAYMRQQKPVKAQTYADRVREINPNDATLPHTIGYWYMAGRQFDQAEIYLKEAAALAPKQADPLASLGELYMQTGQEEKARLTLQQAHDLDDYRMDVSHFLQIAKRLKNFAVKETEHFIIKVDPEHDRVLLEPMAAYLESIYPEVTGDYQFEPTVKTMIEVLPNQSEFSARIAGRAWVPTVGACTGRVIALTAPSQKRGLLGRHNWSQVLRHEFAHTVTLEMSRNRIPHWLTEACAVWQQKDKRAFKYIELLTDSVRRNRLVPVADLDWAFITPKYPNQRMLAYAQSEWILDYIIRQYGFAKLHKMLEAFADGLPQSEVFEKTLGLKENQFDTQFLAWAKQSVRKWGFDPSPPPNLTKAAQAVKQHPNSSDARARYAHALLLAKKNDRALKEAEQARRLYKPSPLAIKSPEENVLALRVLANVHFGAKRYDETIRLCRRIEEIDPTTTTAPGLLARCYLARKDWARAIESLELLQKRQPMDAYSYEKLAKLYTQLAQPQKALPNLIYLHRHTMDDPKYARQIAEIYRTLGQAQPALAFFREVTYIQPYDPGPYEAIATLHLREKQYDQARQAAENLTFLNPKDPKTWTYLATIRYRIGMAKNDLAELKQARADAIKAKQLNPKSPPAVLRFIDAAIQKRQNG